MKLEPASEKEEYFFDTLFHIFVLILILYTIFVVVISPTGKKQFNQTILDGIDYLPEYLQSIDPGGEIKDALDEISDELLDMSDYYKNKEDTTRDDYNNLLILGGAAVIVSLFVGIVCCYFVMKYAAKKSLDIYNIILVNLLLFLVIGCIQMLFFFNVGMNYAPTTVSYLENLIKEEFQKILN